jgi:hypothetical protein
MCRRTFDDHPVSVRKQEKLTSDRSLHACVAQARRQYDHWRTVPMLRALQTIVVGHRNLTYP